MKRREVKKLIKTEADVGKLAEYDVRQKVWGCDDGDCGSDDSDCGCDDGDCGRYVTCVVEGV